MWSDWKIWPQTSGIQKLLSGRTCQGLRAQFIGAGQVLKGQSWEFVGFGQPRPAVLSVLLPRYIINYIVYYMLRRNRLKFLQGSKNMEATAHITLQIQ